MADAAKLPIIDLSSSDRTSTANSIRQVSFPPYAACMDYGFFYLVNHGVEEELLQRVFEGSSNFFSLPLDEKMKLARKENRGYSPLYAENIDVSIGYKGDSKESFYVGPLELEEVTAENTLNQWPSNAALLFGWDIPEVLSSWRSTMETYYEKALCAGKRLISLIALALNLSEDFFEKVGALEPDAPQGFLRLLNYPGKLGSSDEEVYGASAHSDYGMITLLASDGVPGLQVCRDKFAQPQTWENVLHLEGAFIVNIGDMIERWTNNLFRSTMHRVTIQAGHERCSVAFFLDPKEDCIVKCLESCCNESCPPRFPPIRSGDYLEERLRVAYGN